MLDPIRFYFDFSSPYGYFAALKIDKLAAGFEREVTWHPIMLGAVMKITGSKPLSVIPFKSDYVKNDWSRLARFMKIPWTMPDHFPIAALSASRAFYWLVDKDPTLAKRLALATYKTYFGHGKDITSFEILVGIARSLGIDQESFLLAIEDSIIKQRLKDETSKAIDSGVFGSPYFIIDGEAFWGADRLWMIKRWLQSGGW